MLNLTEQTVRYLFVRIVIGHSKYFYALRNLTWALIWVHELGHTGLAYRLKYILN